MKNLEFFIGALLTLCCTSGIYPTFAQEIPSPYSEYYGTVERVIDGDTLVVRLDLWPGLEAIY